MIYHYVFMAALALVCSIMVGSKLKNSTGFWGILSGVAILALNMTMLAYWCVKIVNCASLNI